MANKAFIPGWKVVAGSGIGIAFGSAPVFASGFALLAAAMAKQFGWNQPQVAKAATIYLLVQTIAYPLSGWPLDRWGSRKFAIGSILGFAIGLALLSRVGGSLLQYYLAFAVMSLLSTGTNVISYARAITLWFNRKRGIALGLAASGQAIGAFLVPVLAQKGIANYGWPTALLILAVFEAIVCMPLVALLVKDDPARYGLHPDGDANGAAVPAAGCQSDSGPSVGAIVRTATFWKLAIAFAVMGMSFYAIGPNIVYILKTAGISLAVLAKILAVSGISVLFGRLGFGVALDRVHAPLIGVCSVILFAISSLIYAGTPSVALILFSAVCYGLSIGGETDLMPYLASRYFGTHAVSKIFGWFLFAFFLGATVGPIAFAELMAAFGQAKTPLIMLVALQIVPAALFLSLGRYPAAHAGPVQAVSKPVAKNAV